jgi:hypothetical protein
MVATILEILEKTKTHPFGTALPENFVTRSIGTVDAQSIFDNPHVSLYCLDEASGAAWFVETPPEIDLAQAPFYYVAQYDHALRLFVVPYETFHQFADAITPAKLIFVHSIGRCGSTLISKALNTVEGVRSLSEPDLYTQILFLRYLDNSRDAHYRRLLRSCTLIFGKDTPTLALKFRAMCIQLADLLYEEFPDAVQLFLYRNMESWARSMGIETRPPADRRIPMSEFPLHRQAMTPLRTEFIAAHGREANPVEWSALTWLSLMEHYVALCDAGLPFLAIRYEDIQAHPKRVLAAAFDYCGLVADVDRAYAVFATDSQEGTLLSRASLQERERTPLEPEELARWNELLAERRVIRSADYIAPYTATFEEEN